MTSVALTVESLKRRALSLGAVKTFDYAMQFLLPVALVRCLDAATFGEYRLLWLAVGTVMIVPLNMPQALYYFLPRAEARFKRMYVFHTIAFLALMGLLAAWAVSPWDPWRPHSLLPLARYGVLVPAFVLMHVTTHILDSLPTIDERIGWQAAATVGTSVLRVTLLALAAFYTRALLPMLGVLIGISALRLALLAGYIARFHGLQRPRFGWKLFEGHFIHAAPIGVSVALFGLRVQMDQWVAAHFFALSSFAAFSVAAVLSPIVNIFRGAVNDALLPSMSRLQASGDVPGMLAMNSRANCLVGTLLYPILAFAFLFARDIVTVIYTATYAEAAPVMRVYIIGLGAMVLEIGSLTLLLRQGPFAMRVNLALLALAAMLSYLGALHFGLPGAAAGSVCALFIDRSAMLWRVGMRSGVPFHLIQDWRGLGMSLGSGIAVALAAYGIAELYFSGAKPIERIFAGGAVLAAAYVVLPSLRSAVRLKAAA